MDPDQTTALFGFCSAVPQVAPSFFGLSQGPGIQTPVNIIVPGVPEDREIDPPLPPVDAIVGDFKQHDAEIL